MLSESRGEGVVCFAAAPIQRIAVPSVPTKTTRKSQPKRSCVLSLSVSGWGAGGTLAIQDAMNALRQHKVALFTAKCWDQMQNRRHVLCGSFVGQKILIVLSSRHKASIRVAFVQ